MQTLLSTRRITRSQASESINLFSSKKTEDSCISALTDITNDSPIVGLAIQTPSSGFMCKRRRRIKSTPGSGEALLRCQVKTLLEKVEEKTLPFSHLVTSPMRLLAPTPTNTPQFPNFSENNDQVQIKIISPVFARNSMVVIKEEERKSMSVTRSLMLDFMDKSSF